MKMTFKIVALCVATVSSSCVYSADELSTELRDALAESLTAPGRVGRLRDLVGRAIKVNNVDILRTIATLLPDPGVFNQEHIREAIKRGHAETVVFLLSQNLVPTVEPWRESRSPLLDFIIVKPLQKYRLEWRKTFFAIVVQAPQLTPECFNDKWGNTIETYKDHIPEEILALYRKRFTSEEDPSLAAQWLLWRSPRISGKSYCLMDRNPAQLVRRELGAPLSICKSWEQIERERQEKMERSARKVLDQATLNWEYHHFVRGGKNDNCSIQ